MAFFCFSIARTFNSILVYCVVHCIPLFVCAPWHAMKMYKWMDDNIVRLSHFVRSSHNNPDGFHWLKWIGRYLLFFGSFVHLSCNLFVDSIFSLHSHSQSQHISFHHFYEVFVVVVVACDSSRAILICKKKHTSATTKCTWCWRFHLNQNSVQCNVCANWFRFSRAREYARAQRDGELRSYDCVRSNKMEKWLQLETAESWTKKKKKWLKWNEQIWFRRFLHFFAFVASVAQRLAAMRTELCNCLHWIFILHLHMKNMTNVCRRRHLFDIHFENLIFLWIRSVFARVFTTLIPTEIKFIERTAALPRFDLVYFFADLRSSCWSPVVALIDAKFADWTEAEKQMGD